MVDFNFFLNRQGPKGAQGVKGDTGFSPTIAPSADNDGLTTYKLVITNENNTYETDNLMGNLDIVDDGGTYLRYNREIGSVSASEADTATASAAGVVRLANSTDYTNLADDAVITPSSFADNYNSVFAAGNGIQLGQNTDDKIVIAIDDSTIVTETDLTNALANYVTSSNLSNTLANYVTSSTLNSTLANYATNSALANYVTNSSLSSTLASYVTNSALGTILSNYVTSTALNTELNSYVKNTSLTTTLRDYMTLDTEQTITATKRFEAEQFIGCFHIGNTYQHRISSIGENLTLISQASSTGDSTVNSTMLYMGSGSFSVGKGSGDTLYSLINTSTGLIPDARLSSNIARTNQIPDISTKQDVLVSGTNIKTINGQDILGSGNITIQGGGSGTVDQTFDGTSANAQSGVAIAGAGFLQNTAAGTDSLAVVGVTYNKNYSISIGVAAEATSDYNTIVGNTAYGTGLYATAFGYGAIANDQNTTAIGTGAKANYPNTVAFGAGAQAMVAGTLQIGTGTNNTANTLQVNSYTLLDTSTGLIPDARISTTIDRIAAIESRLSAIEAALNQ